MLVTHESRTALYRAQFFNRLATECTPDQRVEYEAFLEAAIVFARTALLRLKTKHCRHPKWQAWWSPLLDNPSVEFIRTQRNWIVKEAPPKIGQRGFVGSVGGTGQDYAPSRADEFYFFENPETPAGTTLARHLQEIERLVREAEAMFA